MEKDLTPYLDTINLVQSIINDSTKIIDKAEPEILLYLVDKDVMNELLLLELNARESNENKKVKNPFYYIANLLNPSAPSYKYKTGKRSIAKEIYDREKVRKAMEKENIIYKHTERKKLEELYESGEVTADHYRELKAKTEDSFTIDQQFLDEVLANFEDYDVAITDYEDKKDVYYSYVYFSTHNEEGKSSSKTSHLRPNIPNILWYEEDEQFKNKRRDKKIDEIVSTHTRFFGTFYAKKREK